VHVPFTEEADLFKFTPNTRDWNPPTADVRSSDVLVAVEYPADSPIDVRTTAQGVIDKINKYLGWARNDAEQFNRGLAQRARSAIQARRNRVREAYERAQETGIPMRRPDESPKTYIADVLVGARRRRSRLRTSVGRSPLSLCFRTRCSSTSWA
jgi:hypothetical protein